MTLDGDVSLIYGSIIIKTKNLPIKHEECGDSLLQVGDTQMKSDAMRISTDVMKTKRVVVFR